MGLHGRNRGGQMLLLEAQPVAALYQEGGVYGRTRQQHLRTVQ
jgi:hypothetical protein